MPGAPARMLQATDIWKTFRRRPILRGAGIAIEAGSAVAIFGPNGSGKSTLLRVLAGLMRPSRGDVRIAGEDPWVSPDVRRKIGFVSHEPMLYGGLSTLENLRLIASLYGLSDWRERGMTACDLVGLRQRHEPVRSLSRGLAQRAALARAIVHEPEILVLDEALVGLDPESADRIIEFLQRFRARGGAVVLATHDPAEALRIADAVSVLRGGRLSAPCSLVGLDADAVASWYRRTGAGAAVAG
jgi:heme exporter protein A